MTASTTNLPAPRARVFAPTLPSRWDAPTKLWIPTLDLKPAERFGDVCVVLPPDAYRAGLGPCLPAMSEAMKDFSEHDYIIAVGDPGFIGAAAILAYKRTGRLRMLKWDRRADDYFCVEARL
jgi:hypothetical protein